MDSPLPPAYPFLTRDMLSFGKRARLQLQISIKGFTTITAFVRVITREGPSEFQFINASGGFDQSAQFNIPDIPIFVSVFTNDRGIAQGQCWGVLTLLVDGVPYMTLCSGFIYANKAIAWPNVQNGDYVPGRGGFRDVVGSDPAANTEISMTVPDGQLWHLLGLTVTLVTDANAANRVPRLRITTPNGMVWGSDAGVAVTASLTTVLSFAHHYINFTAIGATHLKIPLPEDIYLPPLSTIVTTTDSRQAGDNYGAPIAMIEQLYSSEST